MNKGEERAAGAGRVPGSDPRQARFPYGHRLHRVQYRPDQRMALGPLSYGREDTAGGGAALDRADDHPGQFHPAQRGPGHQGHSGVGPGQGDHGAEVVRGVFEAGANPANSQARTTTSWQGLPG